jgi:hypothetical protein
MENIIYPWARDSTGFMDPADIGFTQSDKGDIDLGFIFFESQSGKIFNC